MINHFKMENARYAQYLEKGIDQASREENLNYSIRHLHVKIRHSACQNMALSNAAKQKRFRDRRAAEFPKHLRAAYLKGLADAEAGLEPAAVETWTDKNAALAYVCGGMDGSQNQTQ